MNRDRFLFVVSGPSGSGKDSVVAKLMALCPGLECSVSATTRPPRPGEEDGVHYFFLSKEEFESRIQQGDLLEYTNYVGNYYGTLKSQVDARLARGVTCVLIIEVEGAANVKRQYPGCTMVFIKPPSLTELERRLRTRGTESEERLQNRLHRAKEELELASGYDYVLVNEDLEACAVLMCEILHQRQGEA